MTELVSLVVSFYNEASGVEEFFERVAAVISRLPDYCLEIVVINDGSCDTTLQKLLTAHNCLRVCPRVPHI